MVVVDRFVGCAARKQVGKFQGIVKIIPSTSEKVGKTPKIGIESAAPTKGAVENHGACLAASIYRRASINKTGSRRSSGIPTPTLQPAKSVWEACVLSQAPAPTKSS